MLFLSALLFPVAVIGGALAAGTGSREWFTLAGIAAVCSGVLWILGVEMIKGALEAELGLLGAAASELFGVGIGPLMAAGAGVAFLHGR